MGQQPIKQGGFANTFNTHSNFTELFTDLAAEKVKTTALQTLTAIETSLVKFTPLGGLAIKLINGTGAVTAKGYVVTPGATDGEVILLPIQVPAAIGVFLDDGVEDGELAWVVVSGIAEVYFIGDVTAGQLARTGLTVDIGEVAGQALAEDLPTSPFADDKHFAEIGHTLESRTGAGLAKCVLHFN